MNKTIYRIAGWIVALAMILGNFTHTQAAGSAYYVSPTGNDANPGTSTAPFKTFAKANSMLTAGSTLYIYAGVYSETLRINKNGTSSAGITVKPVSGTVVIDMKKTAAFGVNINASYVTVSGLEVKNSADICVNLVGSYLTVDGLTVHECSSHGINTGDSSQVKILNSRVYHAALSNASRSTSGGWPSGIKVRESDSVLIQGNIVYNNYGEGMGTRGTNVTIRANTVYNNFSVNIYTNSENVLIERNFVYCTPNSGYERNGAPAAGISMGEEYFSGWGARLKNAKIFNNIVTSCKHGIRYSGADSGVTGGGLKNATIAYNTLYGSTDSAFGVVYESAQTGSLIANNIIWQANDKLAYIENFSGLTFKNNLWKVLPDAALRSAGDRVGDPKFASTPNYTAESYRPASSSIAAGGATNISIVNDYFAKTRGPLYDIGAIQFSGAVAVPTATKPTGTALSLTPTSTATSVPVTKALTVMPATATSTALALPSSTRPTSSSTVTSTALVLATNTRMTSAPSATSTVRPANSPTPVRATLTPTRTPTKLPATATRKATQQSVIVKETVYDNKQKVFTYSSGWEEETKKYAINGSFARTSKNGASVTLKFTGQSFSLIYKGGPSYRKMEVYVDGKLVATVNERRDESAYKLRWDYPGKLAAGPHTLKLVFVTNSNETYGSMDAVVVR